MATTFPRFRWTLTLTFRRLTSNQRFAERPRQSGRARRTRPTEPGSGCRATSRRRVWSTVQVASLLSALVVVAVCSSNGVATAAPGQRPVAYRTVEVDGLNRPGFDALLVTGVQPLIGLVSKRSRWPRIRSAGCGQGGA